MKIRSKSRFVAAALLAGLATNNSHAQDDASCEALKTISGSVRNDYVNLRADEFDSVMNKYVGKVIPKPFDKCLTESAGDSKSYECEKRMQDDKAVAESVFLETVQMIKTCFGAVLKQDRSSKPEQRASFRNTDTGERISVRVGRHVPKYPELPPRYYLRMTFSYLEANSEQ